MGTSNTADDSADPTRVEYRFDRDTPPSIAIVKAMAAIENVDPMEFGPEVGIRLHDHVDSEALDRLIAGDREGTGVTVELTLQGDHRYVVRIRDTGRLVVEKTA